MGNKKTKRQYVVQTEWTNNLEVKDHKMIWTHLNKFIAIKHTDSYTIQNEAWLQLFSRIVLDGLSE